jgi:lipopolysaccharide export system ATP-binding protein
MLEAVEIGKSVRDLVLVDGVSLAVNRGEVVGLLGPGGAGKTTTFRLLAGILLPDRGRVAIDGTDVTGLPIFERARWGLGLLTQEPSVIRNMTVEQNLLVALETEHGDGLHRRQVLESLLDLFHLAHLRRSSAARLSGGERRRCEIARTLANNPRYLMLDEPFAGVDPISVQQLRKLLRILKELGIGILITDHNARELLETVDRAYVIDSGRIVAGGTPDSIINDRYVKRIYLGRDFSSPF